VAGDIQVVAGITAGDRQGLTGAQQGNLFNGNSNEFRGIQKLDLDPLQD
jgi:hypothetical protein